MRDTATAPALTPTQVAIAAMRAQRAALGYPATGPEWLLLDALDESEAENAELRAKVASAEAQLASVDQRYSPVHKAIDAWRTGDLDAERAMRQTAKAVGRAT